nr:family 78 glycoside hydrolase catalytic domain [Lacunisphaera sp.]
MQAARNWRSWFALFAVTIALSATFLPRGQAAEIEQLQVEYRENPIGLDTPQPRFSWRMRATNGARGEFQTAYQVRVTDPRGTPVWDSGKVSDARSHEILYGGPPLQAMARYRVDVTLWDQNSQVTTTQAAFETGLMDPSLAAWEGATWIGGGADELGLYAHYLPVFKIRYGVAIAPGSHRASFVFGANDPRLRDRYKNIFQLESGHNQSHVRLELDLSGLDQPADGRARLKVYRSGYAPADDPDQPDQTYVIDPAIIHAGNRHETHTVTVRAEFGQIGIMIGDHELAPLHAPAFATSSRPWATTSINPLGGSQNLIPFGMLGDIGFSLPPGQQAAFSAIEIANVRSPGSRLFLADFSSPQAGIFRSAANDASSGMVIRGGRCIVSGGERGAFITADPSRNSAPLLRTEFTTRTPLITSARLYITARGVYEVSLNGQRISRDFYNPGLTQYNKTHLYQTYDVTALMATGTNVLGAMLGEGWWSGQLAHGGVWNHFGDRPSLLAKLVIIYADGSRQVATTNPRDWKIFTEGPLRYGSMTMGEVYDARREADVQGWNISGFDARHGKSAVEVPLAGTTYEHKNLDFSSVALTGQIDDTVGTFKIVGAQSVREPRPGVFIYDFGQNVVGVPRLTFMQGQHGRTVTLRYAEMLYPDLPASGPNAGLIMTENLRGALAQDIYIQRDGRQVCEPRFTSHGFQYLEITGISEPVPVNDVQVVVTSSIRTLTAEFESSNPRVNRLWSNLVWSNVGNFLSIPTDCPQRNERMGWSGDLNVFARTATYVSDVRQFLRRHLLAMRDTQTPAGRFTDIAPIGGGTGGLLWGSAGITVPWECYLHYGDTAILREHYPAMKAYMRYLVQTIHPKTGLSTDSHLGDWLGPQNNQLSPAFLATAYHVFTLEIMTRAAEALNEPADAAGFRQAHAERKAFFNTTFVDPGKKVISPPGGRGHGNGAPFRASDTQTAYAVGLALHAFDEELRPAMAAHLAATLERETRDDAGELRPRYSLMTGFIGTAWISEALSAAGRSDLAYRQLQNRTYPSWLYPVDQGATTIWERLDGYRPETGFFDGKAQMNSFNHYSFGAVGQWLMSRCVGIARDEPGFHRFVLRPEPDPTGEMQWARGRYDSPYGPISSSWKIAGGVLTYIADIPANTTATLYLPSAAPAEVRESGRSPAGAPGVRVLSHDSGHAFFELKSGRYEFTCAPPPPFPQQP